MFESFRTRTLPILLAGLLLAGCLSPTAAGMLVCLNGTAPDCCDRHSTGEQLVDGTPCGCCVAVDAAPSSVSASSQKSFVDFVVGLSQFQSVVIPPRAFILRPVIGVSGDPCLSSLRTVILLI